MAEIEAVSRRSPEGTVQVLAMTGADLIEPEKADR
jgi:hypothetical protein